MIYIICGILHRFLAVTTTPANTPGDLATLQKHSTKSTDLRARKIQWTTIQSTLEHPPLRTLQLEFSHHFWRQRVISHLWKLVSWELTNSFLHRNGVMEAYSSTPPLKDRLLSVLKSANSKVDMIHIDNGDNPTRSPGDLEKFCDCLYLPS